MFGDLSKLVGTWETEGQDSSAIITISVENGEPTVIAFDKQDGEVFEVSNVRFESGWLSYEVRVPSTNYESRHRLKAISADRIKQELTLIENWTRVTDPQASVAGSEKTV